MNWGGDEETSIEAWCEYMGGLVGVVPHFDRTTSTIGGIPTDNSLRMALAGPTAVGWREGMRRMVEAQASRPGTSS